jgi:hypothetical protein
VGSLSKQTVHSFYTQSGGLRTPLNLHNIKLSKSFFCGFLPSANFGHAHLVVAHGDTSGGF